VATLTFYGPNSSSTGASLNNKDGISYVDKIEVGTVRLDTYFDNNSSSIDLIKIDAEKGEIDVLEGAKRILAEHKPLIILEVLNQSELDRIVDYLSKHQYQFGIIDDHNIEIKFFGEKNYSKNQDHKLTSYCNIICAPEHKVNNVMKSAKKVKELLSLKEGIEISVL
jgi:hypothetical protein